MNHKEQKKVRTPYPRVSFVRAYNHLLKIKDRHPNSKALTKGQILQALGFRPLSGTANTALGALSHYGFTYKTGAQHDLRYNLTELALRLIKAEGGEDWSSIATKSATQPEVFNFLYSYHKYGPLPNNIEKQLIDKYSQISAKNVSNIIKLFYDSMSFISEGSPVKLPPAPVDDKRYEFSLGKGMVISVSEDVIIKALKHYLKDFELE